MGREALIEIVREEFLDDVSSHFVQMVFCGVKVMRECPLCWYEFYFVLCGWVCDIRFMFSF